MRALYVASDSSSSKLAYPSQPVCISRRPLDVKPLFAKGLSPVSHMLPTSGTRKHAGHTAHVTSDSSPSALHPWCPSLISTRALQANTHGLTPRLPHSLQVCMVLDCNQEAILKLLLLVDFNNLDLRQKQIDVFSGFVNYGLEDVIDVYSQLMEVLAELGGLGEEEASQLHVYCRDAILDPLGLTETWQCPREDSSIVEISQPPQAIKQLPKCRVNNGIKQEKEDVPLPPKQVVKRRLKHTRKHVKEERMEEGVIHWLDGLQSGEEVLENGEVLTTTANMDMSYDADSEEDGSMVTYQSVAYQSSEV